MKSRIVPFIWGSFFVGAFSLGTIEGRTIKKSISVSVLEEIIDGKTFTHRIDVIDGKRKELRAIDGQQVSREEYEEEILEAEKQERRNERCLQEEERIRQTDFMASVQRSTLKKLISIAINQVKDQLHKISDKRIKPFFAFDEQTIASKNQLKQLKQQIIPDARSLLSDDEASLSELQTALTSLERYPARLRSFYQATIARAQMQSDDTRLLKDLLTIVSDDL